jgi:flagellar biosynthetic protein FliQ
MPYEQFIGIGRETLQVVLLMTAPALLAALVAGLIIGVIQAATSINETTLAFVPKLVIVFAVLALAGPFMVASMTGFFETIFAEIGKVGR